MKKLIASFMTLVRSLMKRTKPDGRIDGFCLSHEVLTEREMDALRKVGAARDLPPGRYRNCVAVFRFLLIPFLAFCLIQVSAMADFTSHPKFADIDTKVKALTQRISDAQAKYFAENNRYFQGIRTPEEITDGTKDEVVNWAVSPQTGQDESWKQFDGTTFTSNVKIPFQLEVVPFVTPRGHMWILFIHVWIDGLDPDQFGNYGSHWTYRHGEGPDIEDFGPLDVWFITDWD